MRYKQTFNENIRCVITDSNADWEIGYRQQLVDGRWVKCANSNWIRSIESADFRHPTTGLPQRVIFPIPTEKN